MYSLCRLLAGKWRGNCHPGELGAALRKLGYFRRRDRSDAQGDLEQSGMRRMRLEHNSPNSYNPIHMRL